MSDKTHNTAILPPSPEKVFSAWKAGKVCVCVWLEKLGDANGKCTTPPPEPPRFYFFRSSLCFFPMHMHTMHCIAFAFEANLFPVLKSAPLRPVVVPAVLATPMTEVALRCVVPVPCPVWGWG